MVRQLSAALPRRTVFGSRSPLLRLFVQRVVQGIVTLFAAVTLIFAGTNLLPGNIAATILGQSATPSAVHAMERELGLDQPVLVRYGRWLGGIARGDFGNSYTTRVPVAEAIEPRLVYTLVLAAAAALIAVALSLVLGMLAVLRQGGWIDRCIVAGMRLSVALPEFFVGYLLIALFSVSLQWLPSSAADAASGTASAWLTSLALPCATLVLAILGHMTSMTRAALIDVMAQPFVEMARLKGLPHGRVILRHALPNAIAPIVSIIALNLAYLTVGAVVVETIFVYPGLGQYMVDSVVKRDVPAVQACGVIFGALYVGLNLFADLVAIGANPRLRHPR
ncbi:ABC transporter permease [Paraburkholderia phenoliruptrix]|uniref:ABC transporter permease n=1 Tax=Paraburkholderia phenoliruptrix TaxID=252970 RepID=UPI001C4FCF6D|nr:ABC transporter permease [Paraburkholderia phenoliruptrix]MBW0447785.1 ABC transporter permease [Paraburkholderia phenoliruptrix]MBW9098433.1 ABC transporter permease [Paraburkholderia phenoliruptrix]